VSWQLVNGILAGVDAVWALLLAYALGHTRAELRALHRKVERVDARTNVNVEGR